MAALRLLLIALCVLFVISEAEQATIELREDFTGTGDTEILSDYGNMQDHVNVLGAEKLVYGHSWLEGNGFSGLKAQGRKVDYYVTDSAHTLRVLSADRLNVTAQMNIQKQDEYNTTQYSLYTAEGNGKVRELVQQPGIYGRPVDLLSLWHNGTFRLNSSMRSQA